MDSPREAPASFDLAAWRQLLDGEQAAVRQQVREILSRPSFRYLPVTASIDEQRLQAFRWCRELADEGVGMLAVPGRYGGRGDFAGFMAAFETIAFHDLGMTIKFTVQFGIWLGSVLLLGNRRQHAELLAKIGTFELPGCFAMTEIGHGSNVRELETTAVYDAEREEFVVNSPTWTAGKNYIGNGFCHGRLATVFAQLETQGEGRGVHALLVPLRDEQGNLWPGVRIEDNGPKMGENGVDNARIWFENVRVGRGALLDRFGQVEADGSYRSGIASAGARFFATLSALVGGRISIGAAGLSAAKSGLAIAVRYAARRRQFRAPGAAEDTALLDYPTHQRRLLPLLANALALDFLLKDLVRRRAETLETDGAGSEEAPRQDAKRPREAGGGLAGEESEGERKLRQAREARSRELELLAAGFKAWATWNTTRTLQTCRECCGGEGYMSVNRLPALKADADIFTTFEGDNTVLMLWIGRQRLAEADRASAAGEPGLGAMDNPADEARFHRQLFHARETALIEEIREDLRRLAQEGVTGHAAANRQARRFLEAAHAYVERALLETFARVAEAEENAGLAEPLGAWRELFALSLLEQHRAWYVERGLLSAKASRELGTRVDDLCARLAPQAGALVEAFGIPDQCLAAPMAGVEA